MQIFVSENIRNGRRIWLKTAIVVAVVPDDRTANRRSRRADACRCYLLLKPFKKNRAEILRSNGIR